MPNSDDKHSILENGGIFWELWFILKEAPAEVNGKNEKLRRRKYEVVRKVCSCQLKEVF